MTNFEKLAKHSHMQPTELRQRMLILSTAFRVMNENLGNCHRLTNKRKTQTLLHTTGGPAMVWTAPCYRGCEVL